MKRFLFLSVLTAVLSGCSTYYFTTVDAYDGGLPKNEDGSFTTAKNEIEVTYSFRNNGGDIVYDINNLSGDPVSVDWGRSVLVVEDYAVQFKQDKVSVRGDVSGTTFHFGNSNISSVNGSVSGQLNIPQNDLFIPPFSKVAYSPMSLSEVLDVKLIPKSSYKKQNVAASNAESAEFLEKDTPLVFRSYLTIVNDRDKSQTVFEDSFFISRIIKTGSGNAILMQNVKTRGDLFYIEWINKTAANIGWGVLGAAAVGGMIFLSPSMPEQPSINF